ECEMRTVRMAWAGLAALVLLGGDAGSTRAAPAPAPRADRWEYAELQYTASSFRGWDADDPAAPRPRGPRGGADGAAGRGPGGGARGRGSGGRGRWARRSRGPTGPARSAGPSPDESPLGHRGRRGRGDELGGVGLQAEGPRGEGDALCRRPQGSGAEPPGQPG